MLLVELSELSEGVVAGDIGVENEEGRLILAQDAFGQFQGSSSAEWLSLDGEFNFDVVLLLVLYRWVTCMFDWWEGFVLGVY